MAPERPPADSPAAAGDPPVEYKGGPLDAERGPGLGCFWLQVIVLAVVVILTPLSAAWNWPVPVIIVLLATTLVLLLFVGQTIIFLLRLVAADRRADARRRPLRSQTKTVGEIEYESTAATAGSVDVRSDEPAADEPAADEPGDGGVRE